MIDPDLLIWELTPGAGQEQQDSSAGLMLSVLLGKLGKMELLPVNSRGTGKPFPAHTAVIPGAWQSFHRDNV